MADDSDDEAPGPLDDLDFWEALDAAAAADHGALGYPGPTPASLIDWRPSGVSAGEVTALWGRWDAYAALATRRVNAGVTPVAAAHHPGRPQRAW